MLQQGCRRAGRGGVGWKEKEAVQKEQEMRNTLRDVRRNKQYPGRSERQWQAGTSIAEI